MNTRHFSPLFTVVLLVTACGGGSKSPTSTAPLPPPIGVAPPPPPVLGGFWFGGLTFDMNQTSKLFLGLITEDGQFRFLGGESMTQLIGTQQLDAGHVVGSGLGYADTGKTWLDGSTVVDVITDGTMLSQDSFSGVWSTASGETGSSDFFYDSEYVIVLAVSNDVRSILLGLEK